MPRPRPRPTTWTRTGSTVCTFPDGSTATVPYTRTLNGYPTANRCNVLGGCPIGGHTTVDYIGVRIYYTHVYVTPVKTFLGSERDDVVRPRQRHAHGARPVSRRRSPSAGEAGESGQSLVEFAMIVTVVMLLLLGMLEFGFVFDHHLTLEYATREGARVGVGPGQRRRRDGLQRRPIAECGDRRPADHRRRPARDHLAGVAGRREPT